MIECSWLDTEDARERVAQAARLGKIDAAQVAMCHTFHSRGYSIVRGLVPDALAAAAATAPSRLLEGKQHLPRADLIPLLQNGWHKHQGVRDLMLFEPILACVELLVGARVLVLQTLSLPESSQQSAHSDEILMSTRPRGAMAAAWIALEDVRPDAGPLEIWPGSHRWSYLSMASIGCTPNMDIQTRKQLFDDRYYEAMAAKVAASGVSSEPIILERGDVLFWHQGLVHGARRANREGATRQSLVVHYAAVNAAVYSDAWADKHPIPDREPELGRST